MPNSDSSAPASSTPAAEAAAPVLTPLAAPRDGIPEVIDTAPALRRAVRALEAGTGDLAVDTERASGFRYGQRAFLLQIRRDGSGTWLIDPETLDDLAPLREFVVAMTRLVETVQDEPALLAQGRQLLSKLIADDGWLPPAFAQSDPASYRQYLLYCDPLERFSVVSFVWGPGQKTPVHDHMVWGLIGMLRGAETETHFERAADGSLKPGGSTTLRPGMIGKVSPTIGDIHVVSNAVPDAPSISIHVYGANIGMVHRHVFDMATGAPKTFVSGYSADVVPNLWSMPPASA